MFISPVLYPLGKGLKERRGKENRLVAAKKKKNKK